MRESMSIEDENVDLALARLEAWGQGDSETVLRSLDRAVEMHSPPDVRNAGSYRGVGGHREWCDFTSTPRTSGRWRSPPMANSSE